MEISTILSRIVRELLFWLAWIIIPFTVEIIPSVRSYLVVLRKRIKDRRKQKKESDHYLPEITLAIPIYNSADTLEACLQSIYYSDYPRELMDVLLINNGSTDNSFEVYSNCLVEMKDLPMHWLNSGQGKAKALNMAIFNSQGKYVIHVDSDGKLHKKAIKNIVKRFEKSPDVDCLTGVVLTDMEIIEQTDDFFLRVVRRCEFFEYCQSFLAGRNYESERDRLYTVAGAFSAFRKSALMKSQLYNILTVSEDTQFTFQLRTLFDKGIRLCENAFFIVDPIDSLSRLYTQRQRWQRGEIEVSHMFLQDDLHILRDFFRNFMIRVLLYDHTFAFPRMIWYFAIIFLVFINYPMWLVIGSVIAIYLLYVLSVYLSYKNVHAYLVDVDDVKEYYKSRRSILWLLPLYNFAVFWMRLAGIINSIKRTGSWKTFTPEEEWASFKEVVSNDFMTITDLRKGIIKGIHNE